MSEKPETSAMTTKITCTTMKHLTQFESSYFRDAVSDFFSYSDSCHLDDVTIRVDINLLSAHLGWMVVMLSLAA